MESAVAIEKVSKYYPRYRGLRDFFLSPGTSSVPALNEVSIDIKQGEVFGLLGPNGSGKTTLQKIICGLLTPTSGKVRVIGEAAYVFEGDRTFYWRLTGRQNLEFFAALSGCNKAGIGQRISYLSGLLGLEEHIDKRFASFSAGNRQKLSLIRALVTEPAVLVMDEPTRSLDPGVAQEVQCLVQDLVRREGKTVIWATHNLAEAEAICDRAALLSNGKVVADTSAAGLAHTYFRLMHPEGQVAPRA